MDTENSFSSPEHITVLLHEAVNGLALKENGIYIDGTFGRGGHSRLILSKLSPNGRLIDAPNYVSSREQQTYTRTAENEVKNLFPRLPNPDLVMYVYPHLTDSSEQMPVPGYSSVIPFYGRVQYAQPGERTRMY